MSDYNELGLFDHTQQPLTEETRLLFPDFICAKMIGMKEGFLQHNRWFGEKRQGMPTPRAVRLKGAVRYKACDILEWYIEL